MSDLRLNPLTNDLDLASGDVRLSLNKLDAVVQSLRLRLRFFLGEWFLDTTVGVPYFQEILGRKLKQALVEDIFKQEILSTVGVIEILSFTVAFDNSSRQLSLAFRVLVEGEEAPVEVLIETNPPPIALIYQSTTSLTLGQIVSLAPTTVPPTATAYALISGALPDGVTLNAGTGVFEGTPTQTALLGGDDFGDYEDIVVRATTPDGSVDSLPFELHVVGVALPAPAFYAGFDDDTFDDQSGNAHATALITGAPGFANGAFGRAATFNGSQGFSIANAAALQAVPQTWHFAMRSTQVSQYPWVMGKGALTSPISLGAVVYTGYVDGGKLSFDVADGVGVSSRSTGKVVGDNVWHTVAVALTDLGSLAWVDGQPFGAPLLQNLTTFSSQPMAIGKPIPGGSLLSGYVGDLDEVAVWTNVSLTLEQHQTLDWLRRKEVTIATWTGI